MGACLVLQEGVWGDPKVPKGLNARHLTNHRVALRATFGTLPAEDGILGWIPKDLAVVPKSMMVSGGCSSTRGYTLGSYPPCEFLERKKPQLAWRVRTRRFLQEQPPPLLTVG